MFMLFSSCLYLHVMLLLVNFTSNLEILMFSKIKIPNLQWLVHFTLKSAMVSYPNHTPC